MVIIHVLYFSELTGTEKVCIDLCNEMSKKNDVYLFSNKISTDKHNIVSNLYKNVNFIEISIDKSRYNPFYLFKLAKLVKQIKPDIIHCHNTKFLEIMKYMQIFLSKKIPLVFTKHNWFIKKKMKLADLCIGISPETLELCKKCCSKGKTILIENGISFKTPKIILNRNNFNIVSVGRLEEHKNFQLAIKALSKVGFNFKFYILGQGVYENELKQLIKKLNLDDKIKLLGYINNPWDYIYSSNIQLLPSRLEEFSLALIEGIYYGNMVFALDTANHKEILGNDFIVEDDVDLLAQKLDFVYENYDLYKEKFLKIKQNSQKYSIENVAEKYIKAYKDLIEDFKK